MNDNLKLCTKCREWKILEEFSWNGKNRSSHCKKCKAIYAAKWRDKKRKEGTLSYYNHKHYLAYKNKDIERIRRLKREQALAERRRRGAKPNSRTKDCIGNKIGKKLDIKPILLFLEDYKNETSITDYELAKLLFMDSSFLKRLLNKLNSNISESLVDYILLRLNEQDKFNELYPVN